MSLRDLPALNAVLNATATLFLLAGFWMIRKRRKEAHRKFMLSALGASVLFLASYLIYHFQVGSVRFQRTGTIRTVYLMILATHTVLAAALPVLVVIALRRALAGQFARHRAIARWTLPVWLYVSVTGVVVYWMLYRI